MHIRLEDGNNLTIETSQGSITILTKDRELIIVSEERDDSLRNGVIYRRSEKAMMSRDAFMGELLDRIAEGCNTPRQYLHPSLTLGAIEFTNAKKFNKALFAWLGLSKASYTRMCDDDPDFSIEVDDLTPETKLYQWADSVYDAQLFVALEKKGKKT